MTNKPYTVEQYQRLLDDACALVSLLLQLKTPLPVLQKALSKADGTPRTIVGIAINRMCAAQEKGIPLREHLRDLGLLREPGAPAA
jgi:hypothetical protein